MTDTPTPYRALHRDVQQKMYYYDAQGQRVEGPPPDVRGYLGNVRGDLSGLRGDLDACHLTEAMRDAGIDVRDLITED